METSKPENLVAAHQMMASVNEFLGRTVTSSEHFEKSVGLYSPEQHLAFISQFGLDPGMISLALSVRPLWFLGYADKSMARIQETVTLARAMKHPISIVFAVALAENIHLLRGEAAEAAFLGDEMIAVCREYGLAQEVEWGRCFQALALADLGRVDDGVAQLRDSLAVQAGMHAGLLRPTFLAHLAEALLKADRPDEGLQAVAEGFEAADRGLERYYVAELHRLRAELHRRKGDDAAAERSFGEAMDFARDAGRACPRAPRGDGARAAAARTVPRDRRGADARWRASTAGSRKASGPATWSKPSSCWTSCAERRIRPAAARRPSTPSFSKEPVSGTTAACRAPAVAHSSATECTRRPRVTTAIVCAPSMR